MARQDFNDDITETEGIQPRATKKNRRAIYHSRGNRRTKSNSSDSYEVYIAAARTIARCVDLSCDVNDVIKTVQLIQQEEASILGDLDEEDTARRVRKDRLSKISVEAREHATRTYYKIINIVPSLQELIDDTNKSAELMVTCSKMKTTINSVRSNDAAGIKPRIPQYALPDVNKPASLHPPIVISPQGRAELGFNHPVIARWLCPADQLEIFDLDPEQACKDLTSGKMEMGSHDFPALFWSGKMPGDDYNPDNMCQGLFKSYFLARIGRHIFLGPSSALSGPGASRHGATRSCNAVLHNMLTVEAEHIAYICVQARFSISSKSQWSQWDGNIDYFKMYHGIIDSIHGSPDTEWRDDLLRWWNKELFGDENGRRKAKVVESGSSSGSAASRRVSTVERLNAQMKARVAARSPPSAIDPALSHEEACTPVTNPGPVLREKTPTSAIDPPLCETIPVLSASIERPVLGGSGTTSSARVTNGVSHPESAPLRPLSPITETDSERDLMLTPITKRKGKQTMGGKGGKRPASIVTEGGDHPAAGGRGKRSKRNRA